MRQNEEIKAKLNYFLILLVVVLIVLAAFSVWRDNRQPIAEQPSYRAREQVKDETPEDTGQTASAVLPPEKDADPAVDGTVEQEAAEVDAVMQQTADTTTYTLVVIDGCLQVYVLETGNFYMETAIAYDLLPEQVQEQIDAGKNFDSEEALFEFLENYSS